MLYVYFHKCYTCSEIWLLLSQSTELHHRVCILISIALFRSHNLRGLSEFLNGYNIYVIMKTMYPPGYHHNGFMATIALGHMMYGYTLLLPMNQRVLNKLSKERNISVYIYIYSNDGNNFSSRLSLQSLCGNSCHDVRFISRTPCPTV